MNKVQKLINGIGALLKSPYLINLILESSDFHEKKLKSTFPETTQGLKQISFTDLSSQKKIIISPFAFLAGGSLPTDLALLKILADKKKECVYFEIGTWRGESVANVAPHAKECYTLNLSNKEMIDMGMDEKYIHLHEFYSKHLPHVKHLKGHSHVFDFSAYLQKIDLVFVDGDHHYESVKKDTQTAFTLLKNPQAIIVWHDYSNGPEEIRWEVFRGIWEGTPAEKRKHLYKVSNTQCAVFYPFEINSTHVDFPQTPVIEFEVELRF